MLVRDKNGEHMKDLFLNEEIEYSKEIFFLGKVNSVTWEFTIAEFRFRDPSDKIIN
jgi:hypothetical protein